MRIDHRTSVALIYGASIAVWLVGLMVAVAELCWREFGNGEASPLWFKLSALGLGVLLTVVGAAEVERQREGRAKQMRRAAREAVARAKAITSGGLAVNLLKDDPRFLAACRTLVNPRFDLNRDVDVVKHRADYYATCDDVGLRYYVRSDSNNANVALSHFVALLTDLPPEWILDCASGRNPKALPARPQLL